MKQYNRDILKHLQAIFRSIDGNERPTKDTLSIIRKAYIEMTNKYGALHDSIERSVFSIVNTYDRLRVMKLEPGRPPDKDVLGRLNHQVNQVNLQVTEVMNQLRTTKSDDDDTIKWKIFWALVVATHINNIMYVWHAALKYLRRFCPHATRLTFDEGNVGSDITGGDGGNPFGAPPHHDAEDFQDGDELMGADGRNVWRLVEHPFSTGRNGGGRAVAPNGCPCPADGTTSTRLNRR